MWKFGVQTFSKTDSAHGGPLATEEHTSAGRHIPEKAAEDSPKSDGKLDPAGEGAKVPWTAEDVLTEGEDLVKSAPPEDLAAMHSSVSGKMITATAANGKTETPTASTSTELPAFPEAMWNKLTGEAGSTAAVSFMETWLKFVTDRRGQASWSLSRETRLLAHLENDQERSAAAQALLKQDELEVGQRLLLMAEAVMMARAIRGQFSGWTKLARVVPGILILSILVNSIFVLAGLYLVWQGKLNGLEMSLLAFVFALTAISPATLLLIGRPLEGLDKWTPDAMFNAGKEETEKKTGVTKPGESGKPGDTETDVVTKPSEPEKPADAKKDGKVSNKP